MEEAGEGSGLLFPSGCHAVLAVKVCAPCVRWRPRCSCSISSRLTLQRDPWRLPQRAVGRVQTGTLRQRHLLILEDAASA